MNDKLINLLIARIQNGEQVSLAEGADYFDMTLAEFSELWATTISPALAAAKQKRMNAADVKRAFDEFYALPNNRKYLGGPLFLRLWDDLQRPLPGWRGNISRELRWPAWNSA